MTRHLDIDERDWIDFYLNLTLNAAFFSFRMQQPQLIDA